MRGNPGLGLIAIHFPDKEKARHTDDCEPWVVLGGRELICFLGFSCNPHTRQ